ncbi:MAG: hypothetical protein U1E45_22100 [Geminicoccaceae bacterium]
MDDTPYRLDPEFRARRKKRRFVRLMALGATAAKAAAKLKISDAELDAFTADPDLPEMVEAYREMYGRPEEEILAELRELAIQVLVETVEERDPKVCAWFFRELQRGRNPCVTLATSVVRAQQRAQREADEAENPPPPPKVRRVLYPPRPYDDLEALRHRITVRLRDLILVQAHAKKREEAEARAAAGEPPAPTRPVPTPADRPAVNRRQETAEERDCRRLVAKITGKRIPVRLRDPDFDTS